MKKLISILSLTLLFASCHIDATVEKGAKKSEKKETVAKEADYAKTKFILFKSDYDPKSTYQHMKNYLESSGMFYPRVVDHQTAAKNANMELRPIYLMIFGNPKMGSFLMQENPEVGYELPLKALIYEDHEGQTWVMYKDMNYLKDLYFIKDPNGVIDKMNTLMEGFKKAVFKEIKSSAIEDKDLK